jgi:hypothetical protein
MRGRAPILAPRACNLLALAGSVMAFPTQQVSNSTNHIVFSSTINPQCRLIEGAMDSSPGVLWSVGPGGGVKVRTRLGIG